MLIKAIEGATRVLGKSQGYLGLPVRDDLIDCPVNGPNTPRMMTAWEPTPAELRKIVNGAPIYLSIHGTMPPPVMLLVGEEP
jgi:hypothetical protein